MKLFPKLGERTVRLQIGNRQELEVRKLSILDYDRLSGIIRQTEDELKKETLSASAQTAVLERSGRRICDLLAGYFPEDIAGDLFRLGYVGLIELGMYMAFGSELETGPEASKKN